MNQNCVIKGKYIPRAILVDLEPGCLDSIRFYIQFSSFLSSLIFTGRIIISLTIIWRQIARYQFCDKFSCAEPSLVIYLTILPELSGQDPMVKCSDQTTWCLARYNIFHRAGSIYLKENSWRLLQLPLHTLWPNSTTRMGYPLAHFWENTNFYGRILYTPPI